MTIAGSSIAALTLSATALAGPVCTPSWNVAAGTNGIADSTVNALVPYDDGTGRKIYAIGDFSSATGVAGTANIAAWNGTSWESVGGGLGGNQFTNCGAEYDGELFVGGYFNDAGGVPDTAKIAKWDGSNWSSIGAQLSSFVNSVWALQTWDDGTGEALYIAGNYVNIAGNTGYDHITRWDGTNFTQLGGGTIAGAGLPLIAISLAVWDDGTGEALYVGGRFSEVAGVPANRIAKWDGTQWSALGTGLAGGLATAPYDMVGFKGSLYVGGQQIDSAGGVPVTDVARWDGSQWHEVGSSLEGTVWDLAVFDDGDGPALYAIGLFTSNGNGTPISYVAKLENGEWVDAGTEINDNSYASLVIEEGTAQALFIGGRFTQAVSQPVDRVLKREGCLVCPADIAEDDAAVNVFDLLELIANWGTDGPGAGIADSNDVVDIFDLLALLSAWGPCE